MLLYCISELPSPMGIELVMGVKGPVSLNADPRTDCTRLWLWPNIVLCNVSRALQILFRRCRLLLA